MKKIFAYLVMVFVVVFTAVVFAYTPIDNHIKSVSTNVDTLAVPSKLLLKDDTPIIQARVEAEPEVVEEVEPEVVEPVPAPIPEPELTPPSSDSVSLEHAVGTMSSYGPDCVGCSGYLASGFNGNSSIYYEDPTYGVVRIVAGDSKYPFGTIIKVTNSRWGEFNAIVLDRGGAIGFGRRFLFDLLWSSEGEAANAGTSYDTSFDVLRIGY